MCRWPEHEGTRLVLEATRLAGWEIRRTWVSYVATPFLAAGFGFLAATMVADFEGSAKPFNSVAVDIFFVFGCAALGINFAAKEQLRLAQDPFTKRLNFLRSLPVSARWIVEGRALSLIPALLLNSTFFFVALYVLSWVMGGPAITDLGLSSYTWFALIWASYSLLVVGSNLFCETSVGGRTYMLVQFISFPLLGGLIAVAHGVFGVGVVQSTLAIAGGHGGLAGPLAIAGGIAAFSAWAAAAVRQLSTRDLAP